MENAEHYFVNSHYRTHNFTPFSFNAVEDIIKNKLFLRDS